MMMLNTNQFNTPLGKMIAIADDRTLYLLGFLNQRYIDRHISRLKRELKANIVSGKTSITKQIEAEITDYFQGNKNTFKTPVILIGTTFQQKIWKSLQKIPMGEIRSYSDIARSIKKPTAYRAVAQAIGANPIAIIVPCHRVINSNGNLGGYAGGVSKKQWLLNHERK